MTVSSRPGISALELSLLQAGAGSTVPLQQHRLASGAWPWEMQLITGLWHSPKGLFVLVSFSLWFPWGWTASYQFVRFRSVEGSYDWLHLPPLWPALYFSKSCSLQTACFCLGCYLGQGPCFCQWELWVAVSPAAVHNAMRGHLIASS